MLRLLTTALLLAAIDTQAIGAEYTPTSPLPYAQWTPGSVRTTDKEDACTTKTATVRHVTRALKKEVGGLYKIKPGGEFVYDHLVPLGLGGDNAATNLWPEPRAMSRPKDRCENRARSMVCSRGTLTLAEAQAGFAQDYIKFCASIGVVLP